MSFLSFRKTWYPLSYASTLGPLASGIMTQILLEGQESPKPMTTFFSTNHEEQMGKVQTDQFPSPEPCGLDPFRCLSARGKPDPTRAPSDFIICRSIK